MFLNIIKNNITEQKNSGTEKNLGAHLALPLIGTGDNTNVTESKLLLLIVRRQIN